MKWINSYGVKYMKIKSRAIYSWVTSKMFLNENNSLNFKKRIQFSCTIVMIRNQQISRRILYFQNKFLEIKKTSFY